MDCEARGGVELRVLALPGMHEVDDGLTGRVDPWPPGLRAPRRSGPTLQGALSQPLRAGVKRCGIPTVRAHEQRRCPTRPARGAGSQNPPASTRSSPDARAGGCGEPGRDGPATRRGRSQNPPPSTRSFPDARAGGCGEPSRDGPATRRGRCVFPGHAPLVRWDTTRRHESGSGPGASHSKAHRNSTHRREKCRFLNIVFGPLLSTLVELVRK